MAIRFPWEFFHYFFKLSAFFLMIKSILFQENKLDFVYPADLHVLWVLCGGGDTKEVDQVSCQCATQHPLFADLVLHWIITQVQQVVLKVKTQKNIKKIELTSSNSKCIFVKNYCSFPSFFYLLISNRYKIKHKCRENI